MNFKITLLPGDGIGPEVIDAAATVLGAVGQKYGHDFKMTSMPIGGAAIDQTGVPLPNETLEECNSSDAVLLGAVGGAQWDDLKPHLRPERGLLGLRAGLKLFAMLCPIVSHETLASSSALKPATLKKGVDIMLVREISGGTYYGEHGYRDGVFGQEAFDSEVYSISEVERVAKIAFELAAARKKKLVSVDHADLLTTGKLWRATVEKTAKSYPDVKTRSLLISDCTGRMLTHPDEYDVVLSSNVYGGILAGAFAAVSGSIGMLPSAGVGAGINLYEPVHGAAHDIAGKNIANPIGAILSVAMMLSMSFELGKEAAAVDKAVQRVLSRGIRTRDIAKGKKFVSCSKLAEEIALAIIDE
ncbi:MAG: 3-isopropylmalate dehydrogenase [Clostridiales bacterium]|nr:3-isopropylmalate dehydrogenase [Clostridiales bacterium]